MTVRGDNYLDTHRHRLVKEPWMARIDALAHLMRAVGQVTEARFKRGDDRAFARTLGFRMRPDDAARLQAAYETHVFPLIVEIDAQANEDPDGAQSNFVFFFAPDVDPSISPDAEET